MAVETEQCVDDVGVTERRDRPGRRAAALHVVGDRGVDMVPLERLAGSVTPRLGGEDPDHVLRLAEVGEDLPPILVHRPSMRIIDGVHRVRATAHRGLSEIAVTFYDGPAEHAFVLAVEANVRHGLPLSLAERRAAATRILRTHPDWSDRMIAKTTGLSARTVGVLRSCCATADSERLNTRIGADGRARPLVSADSRRRAAEMIEARPDASLRQVARAVGLSPGTVRDVRDRMRRGEDPVLPPRTVNRVDQQHRFAEAIVPEAPPPVDVSQVLQALCKDPSLRLNESGRELLRWLHLHVIDPSDCLSVTESAPDHCVGVMAELARGCAYSWARISLELAKRIPD
ncbi:hypothetical protein ACWDSJ_02595 [Nocardia sp. NPDC003482]